MGLKFRPGLACADGWKSYSRTDDPPPMVGWLDAHGARLSPEAASSSRVHIYLKISAAQVWSAVRIASAVSAHACAVCLFVCLFACLFVCFCAPGRALRHAAARASRR
jgi:hypothetical protein